MHRIPLSLLFLSYPLCVATAEDAPPPPKPAFFEEIKDNPRERYLHLKSALAHLERAAAIDAADPGQQAETIEAADRVRKLLAAEKPAESKEAVSIELTVYEIDRVKLRDHGLKDGTDWWQQLTGTKLLSRPEGVVADLEKLRGEGIVSILSDPRLTTLSGVEAKVAVGDKSQKMTTDVLPTVLGKKVRLQVTFKLTKPAVALATTVETQSGQPVVISGDKAIEAGKKETSVIVVVKPTIVETQPKPVRETGRGESRQARPLVRPMSR